MRSETSRIDVKVKPRSSREGVEGWQGGALVVRLTAPPVDGAANTALVRLLAKQAGIARGKVRIVSGEKGRSKVVEFEGISLEVLKERLG